MRRLINANFLPWHHREEFGPNNARPNMSGSSIRSTAPRRSFAVSLSGHLDRAHPPWASGLRHARPNLLSRAPQRRREGCPLRGARRPAHSSRARLPERLRGGDLDHPAGMMAPADGSARPPRIRARLSRYGGDSYAYAMLPAGHIDLVVGSANPRRRRRHPHRGRRRWRDHVLERRGCLGRGHHHRRERPARA